MSKYINSIKMPNGATYEIVSVNDLNVTYEAQETLSFQRGSNGSFSEPNTNTEANLPMINSITVTLETLGPISYDTGAEGTSSNYYRSDYIRVNKNYIISYKGLKTASNYAAVAIYDAEQNYIQEKSVAGSGVQTSQKAVSGQITMEFDGYVRITCQKNYLNSYEVTIASPIAVELNKRDIDIRYSFINQAKLNAFQQNLAHKCLNFALITDTHMYQESDNFLCEDNVRLFSELIHNCNLNFAVHCGDVAESGNMTNTLLTDSAYVVKEQQIKNANKFLSLLGNVNIPLYICHGNHDVGRYGDATPGTNAVTGAEWYNIFHPLAGEVVTNSAAPNSNYYYVDYSDYKCRVVVVDYFNGTDNDGYPQASQTMGSEQVAWITNNAFNLTDKTDWNILIFNHARQITPLAQQINQLRTNGTNVILIHGNDHEDDYKNQCFIGTNAETDYGNTFFNNIGVDNGFVKKWLKDEYRYCVDLFCIDFTDGIIYENRLGRGNSRAYRFGSANTSDANNQIISL